MPPATGDMVTNNTFGIVTRGVARFRGEVFPQQRALYRQLAHDGQKPKALMISCADSRVIPEMITQSRPGELFVCRNAGNVVPPYAQMNGGVSSAIEYAVIALGVHDIIVCGHSDCGAMKALLQPHTMAAMPNVAAWLQHSRAAEDVVARTVAPDATLEVRQQALALENVVAQINHLRTHPSVAAGLAAGVLTLHGWLFELEHGRVLTFDGDADRFVVLDGDMPPVAVAPRRGRAPGGVIQGAGTSGAGMTGMMARIARDVSSSFVVFLVAMPLCMGIAIGSGVSPERGLLSGIIGGIVVGTLSGSPLQVSGPAAGLVVMVFDIVQTRGVSALGPILLLAGAVQCAAAALRLGGWFRAISPAVVHAMLAGIGVLIVAGQLHVLLDGKPMASGLDNLMAAPAAFLGLLPFDGAGGEAALLVGIVSIAGMLAWERFRPDSCG